MWLATVAITLAAASTFARRGGGGRRLGRFFDLLHIRATAPSSIIIRCWPPRIPDAVAYSATKWTLRRMTKAAAIDLAPRKIRVYSVHPGPIDTEMLNVRTPEQNRQRLQLVPMKRMGAAQKVASLVLFLLSDESSYITGAEVAIDGGASL
jgi:NAD(P)-dependent dehydrogenase (short-subunit alcohol dehydrogenase family)